PSLPVIGGRGQGEGEACELETAVTWPARRPSLRSTVRNAHKSNTAINQAGTRTFPKHGHASRPARAWYKLTSKKITKQTMAQIRAARWYNPLSSQRPRTSSIWTTPVQNQREVQKSRSSRSVVAR